MGKKYIAILLAFAMLLGMTACGAGNQAAEEPTAASTTAQATVEAASEPAEPAIYTFTFDGMMGKETAQFELSPDGSCKFSLPGNPMLTDVYAGTFTREGDTVTVEGLTNVDTTSSFTTPGLWDWIVDGGTVIKQYYHDQLGMTYLFSLNRKRKEADVLIYPSSGQTIVCQGRVITSKRYPLPSTY